MIISCIKSCPQKANLFLLGSESSDSSLAIVFVLKLSFTKNVLVELMDGWMYRRTNDLLCPKCRYEAGKTEPELIGYSIVPGY